MSKPKLTPAQKKAIVARHGQMKVALVERVGYVEAMYQRISRSQSATAGEPVWVLDHWAEMKAPWARALEMAEGIVNAPPKVYRGR